MKILIKAYTNSHSLESTLKECIEAFEKLLNDHPDITYDDVEVVIEET